jgi:glycosyltransferase involved in cell wall biosynthesis
MKLAIVYHAYKNSAHLKKSLDSILLQTDQNFEFIFINDGAAPGVTKIIKEIDFSKFKKLTYFKYSQNFGHATCFNQIIATTNADYVMFVGANFIPDQAFVKTLNDIFEHNPDVDVLSFNTIKNDRQYLSFDKLNSKMNLLIDQSMKDKIFSVKLLRKHQILFNEHAYFPLLFIYQVMSQFKK